MLFLRPPCPREDKQQARPAGRGGAESGRGRGRCPGQGVPPSSRPASLAGPRATVFQGRSGRPAGPVGSVSASSPPRSPARGPLLFAGPGPGSDGSPGARGPAATPPPPGTRRSAGSPAAPQVRGRGRGTLILKGGPPAVVCTLTQWKALGRRSACYQLHVVPAAAVSPGG